MKRLMEYPWKDRYSTLLVMKWLIVDPWKDLSWRFFVMKRLKLDPWKDISSTLTRMLDRVFIVSIPLLDFQSLFISRGLGLGIYQSVSPVLFPMVLDLVALQYTKFCVHSNCTINNNSDENRTQFFSDQNSHSN